MRRIRRMSFLFWTVAHWVLSRSIPVLLPWSLALVLVLPLVPVLPLVLVLPPVLVLPLVPVLAAQSGCVR